MRTGDSRASHGPKSTAQPPAQPRNPPWFGLLTRDSRPFGGTSPVETFIESSALNNYTTYTHG